MNKIDARRGATYHRRFRHWNLNLIVAFDALLQESGNVTQAAERLAISQSAMSHALARLRRMFDDPLFIRTGARMAPSARALELAPQVAAWLESSLGLLKPAAFDAARASARVRLALPELFESLLLPPLLGHLARHAPGIEIHANARPLQQILEGLDQGDIDLAIVPVRLELRAWHCCQPLIETDFSMIYNPELVPLPVPATLQDVAAFPQLSSSYLNAYPTLIDLYFQGHGLTRRKQATSIGLAAIPAIVAAVPIVSILPSLAVNLIGLPPGVSVQPFARGELTMPVQMIWHQRHDNDEAQRYVRQYLIERLIAR